VDRGEKQRSPGEGGVLRIKTRMEGKGNRTHVTYARGVFDRSKDTHKSRERTAVTKKMLEGGVKSGIQKQTMCSLREPDAYIKINSHKH